MERDEILSRITDILVEALGVDEEEVVPDASLTRDLGAESIDFLDIAFQLEKAFGIKIEPGELFPENVAQNPEYVQDGKITQKGLDELKAGMPHADFSELDRDPDINKVGEVFTVDAMVRFVESKLATV